MEFEPLKLSRELTQLSRWLKDNNTLIFVIVIDEIHTVLTSAEFRPALKEIKSLMLTMVPVTFLTATLPIRLEESLKKKILMPREHNMIRARTARPEHQYFLFTTEKGRLVQDAIAFITLASSSLLYGSRRGIVFVRSKPIGHKLSSAFPQTDFLHAEIKDDQVRLRMIEKWKDGLTGGWIIGTTSLIQGVDYHDVHVVLFVDSPFGLIDFVQGAGRVGRNGQPSKVIVLDSGTLQGPCKTDPEDLSCKREMIDWLASRGCRRIITSKCMDGVVLTCNDLPGAIPCDVCKPNHDLEELWAGVRNFDHDTSSDVSRPAPRISPSTTSRIEVPSQLEMVPIRPQLASGSVVRHSQVQNDLREARLETALQCIQYLEEFYPNCGICHAESGGKKKTGKQHKIYTECKRGAHFTKFYDWNKPKSQSRPDWTYDASAGYWCYACALPQQAIKIRGPKHSMSDCKWSDIMMGVAWSIWHNDNLFEEMKGSVHCTVENGSKCKEKMKFLQWLIGEDESKTGYNIHRVWLWYYKKFCGV